MIDAEGRIHLNMFQRFLIPWQPEFEREHIMPIGPGTWAISPEGTEQIIECLDTFTKAANELAAAYVAAAENAAAQLDAIFETKSLSCTWQPSRDDHPPSVDVRTLFAPDR